MGSACDHDHDHSGLHGSTLTRALEAAEARASAAGERMTAPRRRVLALLKADGVDVRERSLTRADVEAADEVFSSGNYGKVVHVNRVEDRKLEYGPLARRAHKLYMDYAESTRKQ